MIFTFDAAGCENKDKVPAIKGIRALTGLGIKEAKDLVESSMDGNIKIIKAYVRTTPEDKKARNVAIDNLRTAGCIVTKCAGQGQKEMKKMIKHAIEVEEFELAIDLIKTFERHFGVEDDLS